MLETVLPAALISLLHIAGPDHLGTLMALSSLTRPIHAFHVGALWSLGHCAGMGLVALIAVPLGTLAHTKIEEWEHIGNYVVGISMVCVGIYFVHKEDEFLQVRADGSVTLQGCSCHTPPQPTPEMLRLSPTRSRAKKFIIKQQECCDSEECGQPATESTALLGEKTAAGTLMDWRAWQGILIGLLQGACCPAAIVGLSVAAEQPSLSRVLCFVVLFLAISAVGAGLLAAAWAWTTQAGLGVHLPPALIYRFSCYGTLLLGVLWAVANFCGILDRLDYTAGLHDNPVVGYQRLSNMSLVELQTLATVVGAK